MNIGRVLKHINLLDELGRKEAQKTTNKNTARSATPAKGTLKEIYREVARKNR